MKTAIEVLNNTDSQTGYIDTLPQERICIKAMIEFAHMHVQAALKAASEQAFCDDGALMRGSILQAYPSTNIK